MNTIRHTIILVDDNLSNLAQGKDILKPYYKVFPAPSAAKLFEALDNIIPDLILLDIEMPDMSGFEVIKKLKADPAYKDIPVIFLTSKRDEDSELRGFDLGAMDFVVKPFSAPKLLKRIENQLLIIQSKAALRNYAENLENMVREKTEEVIDLQNAVLETVADLVEFRDKLTGGHVTRTQLYMKALLEELIRMNIYLETVSKWDMDHLLPSAQLHDVGKIAITDDILNKPARLTPDEFEVMKTHVDEGILAIKKIMSNAHESAFLYHALLIAGTHHEKWDGSGYPEGLKGESIPLEGRLMAIADVYDALISERPYKKALKHEEACRIIEESSGTHFDPTLVEVFRKVEADFSNISQKVQ